MMEVVLDDGCLPEAKPFEDGIRRAPRRTGRLEADDRKLALRNALRYIPERFHEEMAPEFAKELEEHGRIYGYRFRPEGRIYGRPVESYPGKILKARAIQVMIDNNLDFEVALYPYELVTYGESGQVCQNWMQYRLIKHYLTEMEEDQTLVVASGHPVGLFPSRPEAPRAVMTNGLMVGAFDTPEEFARLCALGCANYGQMTAGGWMYIGPQGIVHGTYITLLNAGRLYLGIPDSGDLHGIGFVTSGLGGMSGAQAKALEIAGGTGIIAEVDPSRIETRRKQGWVSRTTADPNQALAWYQDAKNRKEPLSIAFCGSIVSLLAFLVEKGETPELLSDQTSCHAAYQGGYTPDGVDFEEGRRLLAKDPEGFAGLVDDSLRRHFGLIKELCSRGAHFWDYGNSFLKAVYDAGVKDVARRRDDPAAGFIFPSYVEDIMGPICFDYGYGPFRWVCLSGKEEDLARTDRVAMECIDPTRRPQDRDNYCWIRDAAKNRLVVGTKARILYADEEGRVRIALAFNHLVRKGEIGPVMIGRDHHDTGGTDSPFRETANIHDGSNLMSDMAHHCFGGAIARGLTMVVLSNGGGVGTGKAVNGGNGIVLDGSEETDRIVSSGLSFDVMGGVARRAWARNEHALATCRTWNENHAGTITLPVLADDAVIERALAGNRS